MSQENVELVRRIYDAWEREESAREFIAADLEYVNPSYAVEPGTIRGRKSLGLVRDTYSDFEIHVERFLDTEETTSSCSRTTPPPFREAAYPSPANTDTCGLSAMESPFASVGSNRTGRPSRPPARQPFSIRRWSVWSRLTIAAFSAG